MKSQISRLSLALVCSLLGAATAYAQAPQASQRPTPPPSPVTPESHSAATHGGTVHSGARASATTGWNYFHATNCLSYYDGSTNWVYVYPREGGFWFTPDRVFQETFLIQCQQGYWVAIYVFDATTGNFSEVYTYDFR
jgi:hypothetical protein